MSRKLEPSVTDWWFHLRRIATYATFVETMYNHTRTYHFCVLNALVINALVIKD